PSRRSHLRRWWSLTPPFHPYPGTSRRRGGLFSVALSRGSPRVGVTDHPALWSPDLPRRTARIRRDRPADSPSQIIRRPRPTATPARRAPAIRAANNVKSYRFVKTYPSQCRVIPHEAASLHVILRLSGIPGASVVRAASGR